MLVYDVASRCYLCYLAFFISQQSYCIRNICSLPTFILCVVCLWDLKLMVCVPGGDGDKLFIVKNNHFCIKYEFQGIASPFISKLNVAFDSLYRKT